jgi:hypothetical protein
MLWPDGTSSMMRSRSSEVRTFFTGNAIQEKSVLKRNDNKHYWWLNTRDELRTQLDVKRDESH